MFSIFFFFNDPATTEIYTLSLHDALPISKLEVTGEAPMPANTDLIAFNPGTGLVYECNDTAGEVWVVDRSEEHTSELQSLAYLVCRLLLEKKKKKEKSENVCNHISSNTGH